MCIIYFFLLISSIKIGFEQVLLLSDANKIIENVEKTFKTQNIGKILVYYL